jgi:hypothetical protein
VIPLAHGVGTRADLPLPVTLVVVGAGVALVASFVGLGALWRTPRLTTGEGRPAPRALDDPRLRTALQAGVLALSAFVLVVAWTGPASVTANLAPWVLYVTFWVGLVPLSLLLGPVWHVVNPLRTLQRFLPSGARPELAARLGAYPAAVSLLAFAWLELASPNRSDPRHVAVFLTVYAGVHLLASAYVGSSWFVAGEGFGLYSRLLGSLAPLGRGPDGRLVWRSPLRGAATFPAVHGLWSVVVVLVGSTAFDGLTRTTTWQSSRYGGESNTGGATLGLTAVVVLVGVLYASATQAAGRTAGVRGCLDRYAHTLAPIAAGYAMAHYFSLFLLDGQTTFLLASDPFGTGANLFGTAGGSVNYLLVSPRTISLVQVGAIVVGHVVGLLLAHERALVLDGIGTRPHRPWVAQLPLLAVMVVLTCGGLLLLLGS